MRFYASRRSEKGHLSRAAFASWQWVLVFIPFFVAGAVRAQPYTPTRVAGTVSNGTVQEEPDVRPGLLMVRLRQPVHLGKQARSTGLASVDEALSSLEVQRIDTALRRDMLGKRDLVTAALDGVYRITYTADIPPLEAAELLAVLPDVRYAEPLYLHRTTEFPNDTSYPDMEQFVRVEAEAAWNIVKGGDGDVVIAIVDGGTDWDHRDLVDNVWTNTHEIPGNGLDDDENGFVDDVHGWNFPLQTPDPTGLANTPSNAAHGTHVAGIAAARTDNAEGIASLSWNARFMPVNAGSLLADDNLSFGYEGIMYAAANGADIINCSWGRLGGGSQFERDVVDFARDNGSLIVAAAGNESNDMDSMPQFPAAYRHVLSVGATGKANDSVASFSNFGVSVDVYAPGVSILSTTPSNTYNPFFSGTSMASPMAAALAALVKTQSPALSVDELRERIRRTADVVRPNEPSRRINARRALTDPLGPSVRFLESTILDASGDGVIAPGEIVDIQVTFSNVLADSPSLTVTASTNDAYTTVLNGGASLPPIQKGQTGVAVFRIVVSSQVPIHHSIVLYTDIQGDSYQDRDVFSVIANPSQILNHDTNRIQTSITSEGNIGALGFAGDTAGLGFMVDGTNFLFEGGLMIGNSVETVSDCIRGLNDIQDDDFRPAFGSELTVLSPGVEAFEVGSISLVDSLAGIPLGVTVHQESFADRASENQNFLIFRYTVKNDNPTPLDNVFVGLFFDWDLSAASADNSSYDSDRKMGIISENKATPTKYAATRLLTSSGGVSYKTIDNDSELYNGFTDAEKWSSLSGGLQAASILPAQDVSQLIAEGPFTIDPGDSVQVAFAVLGATTYAELIAASDQSQVFYDKLSTASEPLPVTPPVTSTLNTLYPNPFRDRTTISFSIPSPETVTISVYDLLGRRVAHLIQEPMPAGAHQMVWDGRTEGRQLLASGLYFVRMTNGAHVHTEPVMITR